MDTDVEVVKGFDEFLKKKAFSGFQTENSIPTGTMASEKGFSLFKEMLYEYADRSFYNADGSLNLTTNVKYITDTCLKYGLKLNNKYQNLNGFEIYPYDWFCAKSYKTGELDVTNNTHTIHHFSGSWLTGLRKIKSEMRKKFINKFGSQIGTLLWYFCALPIHVLIILKKD